MIVLNKIHHLVRNLLACANRFYLANCELLNASQASGSGRTFEEVVDPDHQPISQLWRYKVDSANGETTSWPLSHRAMEFPAVNPEYIGKSLCRLQAYTLRTQATHQGCLLSALQALKDLLY